jgi:hypothetical protein
MEPPNPCWNWRIACGSAFVRDALNLFEGTRLTLDVRGKEIELSKRPAWRKLQGAAADRDLMSVFAAFKKQERAREDSRP